MPTDHTDFTETSAHLVGALHRKAELLAAFLGEKETELGALRRLDTEALESGRRVQEELLAALESVRQDAHTALRQLWRAQGLPEGELNVEQVTEQLSQLEAAALRGAAARVRDLVQTVRAHSDRNAAAAHNGKKALQGLLDATLGKPTPEAGPLYGVTGRARGRSLASQRPLRTQPHVG